MNRYPTCAAALALLGLLASSASSLPAQTPDFDGAGAVDALSLKTQEPAPTPEGVNVTPQLWASTDTVDVFSDLAEAVPDGTDQDKIELNGKTLWRGTQLGMGEMVEVTEVRDDGWAHVNVPNQNYSGWVRRTSLGEDPKLAENFRQVQVGPAAAGKNAYREAFLNETKRLEGVPYVWGGRSPRGVDCSGLVQLAFSYIGMGSVVPRTAHEQRNHSRPVDPKSLKAGDLIFSAHLNDPSKITHVMVYIGEGMIREAPHTGSVVRTTDVRSRLGLDLQNSFQGQKTRKYVLYFGTYFKD